MRIVRIYGAIAWEVQQPRLRQQGRSVQPRMGAGRTGAMALGKGVPMRVRLLGAMTLPMLEAIATTHQGSTGISDPNHFS